MGQSVGTFNTIVDGKFVDDRWAEGRWVISKFPTTKTGETDWDKVGQEGKEGRERDVFAGRDRGQRVRKKHGG